MSLPARLSISRGGRLDVVAKDASAPGNWVFSTPGTCRVALEYRPAEDAPVRSNAVTVTVREPTGDEATVWAAIQAHRDAWEFLSYQGTPSYQGTLGELPPSLVALIDQHPRSAYLQRPRFQQFVGWAEAAGRGCGPNVIAPCFAPDEQTPAASRRHAAALIGRAQPLLIPENVWAPDVLRIISHLQTIAGDEGGHTATLRRLAQEYPDRAAGRWARWELEP